jgi:hypothetical protein
MKNTTLLLATLFAPLLAGRALAQGSHPDDAKPTLKHYDFDDDQVEADRLSPDGVLIAPLMLARHKSLIELRTDFNAEMLKRLESL